jgi:hypothetical protein
VSSAWQTRYAHKLCTAAEAVQRIEPGRRIFIGSGAAEPAGLVKALVAASVSLALVAAVLPANGRMQRLLRRRGFTCSGNLGDSPLSFRLALCDGAASAATGASLAREEQLWTS